MKRLPILVTLLRDSTSSHSLTLADWDLVIRQARSANLIGSLYTILRRADQLKYVPEPALRHMEWTTRIVQRQKQAVHWEIEQLKQAFASDGLPLILLKGAAYVMAELPLAEGRLFSDIDLIVPKEKLDIAEAALMGQGWETTHHDPYDQHYYRTWMHELPPMQHVKRSTVVDVHHAILPETASIHPPTSLLLSEVKPVVGHDQVFHFAPIDMLLHSVVHLFHDGELEHGMRDLLDIHLLLGQFGDEEFWRDLPIRAAELGLGRPLYYGLRYVHRILGAAIPNSTLQQLAPFAPSKIMLIWMDGLFERALLPDHASCRDAMTGFARFALYIRANWLRMPPLLLTKHLFHKAFLSPKES